MNTMAPTTPNITESVFSERDIGRDVPARISSRVGT